MSLFVYKMMHKMDSRYPKTTIKALKLVFFFLSTYLKLRNKIYKPRKSVIFAGQAYYNAWYLSRELRKLGWKADVLNWDENPASQIYYHGEDFKFQYKHQYDLYINLCFYLKALLQFDVYHFSNTHGMQFGATLSNWFKERLGESYEIHFIKSVNKKIVYSNNGCLDGVSQTAFSKWGPDSVCDICVWKNEALVCCDERNLTWGAFRNHIADYQCLFGGNRADFNDSPLVHEVPEFYCLNDQLWHPDIVIPDTFKLKRKTKNSLFVYHTVGNKKDRTNEKGINIKSSHIYLPLIEKLNQEGMDIELISPEGIPNKDIRYYQVQADIFLDMLTYGWYGATAREAMMLGKPVVCYIRPEWLESLRQELPECADTLPIISATPETAEMIIRDLINNPEKRMEIGRKSREFCLRWHSDTVSAKRFDEIYTRLLQGDLQPKVSGKLSDLLETPISLTLVSDKECS